MITKTDFDLLEKLDKNFNPVNKGFLLGGEVERVETTLQLGERDLLNLRNLRNTVVMYFTNLLFRTDRKENDTLMDKCSGIVGVIDSRIFNLGGEV